MIECELQDDMYAKALELNVDITHIGQDTYTYTSAYSANGIHRAPYRWIPFCVVDYCGSKPAFNLENTNKIYLIVLL